MRLGTNAELAGEHTVSGAALERYEDHDCNHIVEAGGVPILKTESGSEARAVFSFLSELPAGAMQALIVSAQENGPVEL
jgi:hypothetical protein